MAVDQYVSNELMFGVSQITWSAMAAGDTGQPNGSAGSGDRTVQISGVFGSGGVVTIEGTLDMINWNTLRDPFGALLSFTGPGLKAVLENVVALRPNVNSGDITTAINVVLTTRKSLNG